jgi:hypothetical protein
VLAVLVENIHESVHELASPQTAVPKTYKNYTKFAVHRIKFGRDRACSNNENMA